MLEVDFISDQGASNSLLQLFCAAEEAPRRVQELMLGAGTSGKKPEDLISDEFLNYYTMRIRQNVSVYTLLFTPSPCYQP